GRTVRRMADRRAEHGGGPLAPSAFRQMGALLEFADHGFSEPRNVIVNRPGGAGQLANDVALARAPDRAITVKGRQDAVVPEILAPCFELLRRATTHFAHLNERFPQAMRIEVCEPGPLEGLLEDRANWCSAAPVLPFQRERVELPIATDDSVG